MAHFREHNIDCMTQFARAKQIALFPNEQIHLA